EIDLMFAVRTSNPLRVVQLNVGAPLSRAKGALTLHLNPPAPRVKVIARLNPPALKVESRVSLPPSKTKIAWPPPERETSRGLPTAKVPEKESVTRSPMVMVVAFVSELSELIVTVLSNVIWLENRCPSPRSPSCW